MFDVVIEILLSVQKTNTTVISEKKSNKEIQIVIQAISYNSHELLSTITLI